MGSLVQAYLSVVRDVIRLSIAVLYDPLSPIDDLMFASKSLLNEKIRLLEGRCLFSRK